MGCALLGASYIVRVIAVAQVDRCPLAGAFARGAAAMGRPPAAQAAGARPLHRAALLCLAARQVEVSHILVGPEKKDLIPQLRERLAAGEDFKGLAAEHSQCPSRSNGGSLGWIARGQTVPEFEEGRRGGSQAAGRQYVPPSLAALVFGKQHVTWAPFGS